MKKKPNHYDNSKVLSLIGKLTPLEKTLDDMVETLVQFGIVKK